MVWVTAFNRPTDVQRGRRVQPAAAGRGRHPDRTGQPGHACHDDRGGSRQARRHQDPRAQRQRTGRPGRRGRRRPSRSGLRPADRGQRHRVQNTRLQCQGQIRFGPAGRAAAAALWLVAPCTELYQDQRGDDTVDLAIGTDFGDLSHNDDTDAVLASLRPDATQPADPLAADQGPRRRLLTRSSGAPARRSAASNSAAMPGAAATMRSESPPSTGGRSSRAPASAAISAPAAQSQTWTPSS